MNKESGWLNQNKSIFGTANFLLKNEKNDVKSLNVTDLQINSIGLIESGSVLNGATALIHKITLGRINSNVP